MAHSKKKVEEVKALRRNGESLIGICRITGIAKSTASAWCRNVDLPDEIKLKMHDRWESGFKKGIEVMRIRRENEEDKWIAYAKILCENVRISKNKELLQIYAALLYWCEGSKQPFNRVTFTNSDPTLVSAFLYCLRGGFDLVEEKFSANMHLHGYHNESDQIQFWSKITNISVLQFRKTFTKRVII